MKALNYYVIYSLLWFFTLPPLWFLYGVSDIFYVIVYNLIGYRKKVTLSNLKNAFPDKSNNEIYNIAKKFYRHLCDTLIETFKAIHLNEKQILKRYKIKNIELLQECYMKDKDIVLVSGHYGNWEWMSTLSFHTKYSFLVIYQPLQNKAFDKIINDLRGKFGFHMVAMTDVYKELLNYVDNKKRVITWFLADHRPHKSTRFWIDFLGREVSFHVGAEKIACKLNHTVVFFNVNKIKRGYYEAEFFKLEENPNQTEEFGVTTKFVRKLEEIIKTKPEYWIWSHRRWKNKKK